MEVFDERSEAELLNDITRIYLDKKDEVESSGEHYSNVFEELDEIVKGFMDHLEWYEKTFVVPFIAVCNGRVAYLDQKNEKSKVLVTGKVEDVVLKLLIRERIYREQFLRNNLSRELVEMDADNFLLEAEKRLKRFCDEAAKALCKRHKKHLAAKKAKGEPKPKR